MAYISLDHDHIYASYFVIQVTASTSFKLALRDQCLLISDNFYVSILCHSDHWFLRLCTHGGWQADDKVFVTSQFIGPITKNVNANVIAREPRDST